MQGAWDRSETAECIAASAGGPCLPDAGIVDRSAKAGTAGALDFPSPPAVATEIPDPRSVKAAKIAKTECIAFAHFATLVLKNLVGKTRKRRIVVRNTRIATSLFCVVYRGKKADFPIHRPNEWEL